MFFIVPIYSQTSIRVQRHCHATLSSLKIYSLNSFLIAFASWVGLLALVIDKDYRDLVDGSFLQAPSVISPVVISSLSTSSLVM